MTKNLTIKTKFEDRADFCKKMSVSSIVIKVGVGGILVVCNHDSSRAYGSVCVCVGGGGEGGIMGFNNRICTSDVCRHCHEYARLSITTKLL